MNEFVKLIASLSISGGIMALALLALKPLLRYRFSKSFQYYIWLIVLIRFALPFTLEVNLVNTLMNDTSEAVIQMRPIPIDDDFAPGTATTDISVVANEPPVKTQAPPPKAAVNYPFAIWLIGATFSLIWGLLSYLRFTYALKRSNNPAKTEEIALLKSLFDKREVALYRNPMAKTPMLIGVFRPAIVLPEAEYSESQLRNILSHELIHLRRFDIAIRWITTLVVAAHWFNPIVYFMRREINRACELACDEAVIKSLDRDGKQSYGETLISVVAESRYPYGVVSTTMCEEKRTLKERLVSIMKHKAKPKGIVMISVVVLLLLTVGALALGAKVTNEVMSADAALTELKNSIEYSDSNMELSFRIPSDYPPDNWNIIIAGREEIKHLGGMNVYFFEEENDTHSWIPGKRYSIPMTGKNYTDLLMAILLPEETGRNTHTSLDLLSFKKGQGFTTNPAEPAKSEAERLIKKYMKVRIGDDPSKSYYVEYSIGNIAQIGNYTFAVAKNNPKEGQGRLYLFVFEKKADELVIINILEGELPLSMGVAVYKFTVSSKTVVFGIVNDQIWLDLDGAPEKVYFTEVKVLHSNGEERSVKVSNFQMFMLSIDGDVYIDDVLFLSGSEVAGKLSELRIGKNVIDNFNKTGDPSTLGSLSHYK